MRLVAAWMGMVCGAGCSLLSLDGAPDMGGPEASPRMWVDLTTLAEPAADEVMVGVMGPGGRGVWGCAQLDEREARCGAAAGWWDGPGTYRIRATHRANVRSSRETAEAMVT